jgi:hypothetical protein
MRLSVAVAGLSFLRFIQSSSGPALKRISSRAESNIAWELSSAKLSHLG